MTTQIIDFVLVQLPVVAFMSFFVWNSLKEKQKAIFDCKKEKKQHRLEIAIMNERLLKEEKENYRTLKDLIVILEDVETNQKLILSQIHKK